MPEQIYNKVVVNNTTLIDLSEDTVTSANHIVSGRIGHLADGSKVTGTYSGSEPSLQSKTATPTETAQTITADSGYDGLSSVEVGAISSTYVGSGITRRDGDDLTASGATVSVPAGYYNIAASKTIDNANLAFNSITNSTPGIGNTSGKLTLYADVDVRTSSASTGGYVAGGQQSLGTAKVYLYSNASYNDSDSVSVSGDTITIPAGYYNLNVTKSVASGTAGTPTATKGTVSNHSISVTPSVTNTTGYITGGTKSGTAVSVSASELVSGTYSVTSSGTKDVTNYASASVPAGTEGTPTATKGSVSNHSISVTPSVTNSSGFITGSTKTGTAVSVSASELVSGTRNITANGTGIDVTNYANVDVAVENTDFIVTFTKNSSTGVWEPDCTYAELLAAYNAGKTIVGITPYVIAGSDATGYAPCAIHYEESQSCFIYTIGDTLNDWSGNYGVNELSYFFKSTGVTLAGDNSFYSVSAADASASDVVSGKIFFNASGYQTGTLVVQHYYTGSTAPSSSLGANGDIYLQS